MNALEKALAEVDQEINVLVKTYDTRLAALGAVKTSLNQAIHAMNATEAPVSKPNGNTLPPKQPQSLRDGILDVLADDRKRTLNEILDALHGRGWASRSERPASVVGHQLRVLVEYGVVKRTGKRKHYRYHMA